jgi:hypothetical protein
MQKETMLRGTDAQCATLPAVLYSEIPFVKVCHKRTCSLASSSAFKT